MPHPWEASLLLSLALCEVFLPFECNVHFESLTPAFILIALFPPVKVVH